MDSITIDGLNEDDFRCSIEGMLREGQADAAAAKLRLLIEPYAGEGGILPGRLLSVSPADFTIKGWQELGNRLGKYDRPGHWVSALGISIVHPSEAAGFSQEAAKLSPCIETSFYCDDAYPFSKSDRDDLLEGYTRQGAEWQGNFEQADMTLSVTGVEDLFEAIARLEEELLASEAPDDEHIRAGSLGACYLSVLLHLAVRDRIRKDGLPRPLCVMTGCVGVYPFFDAPAMSSIECLDGGFLGMEELAPARKQSKQAEEEEAAEPEDSFGSLLSLTGRIAKKKMVMELDEEETAAASRQFEMASAHQLAEAGEAPPRTGAPDFSAYAFEDDGASPPPEDDDWSDIPDSPSFSDSPFDKDMDDWFSKSGQEDMPNRDEEGEVTFPIADVASGWNIEEAATAEPGYSEEPLEQLAPEQILEQEPDIGEDEYDFPGLPQDVPHPDAAGYIPPPPPVGHGLRARLVQSAQPVASRREGPFGALVRLISWIRRKLP